MINYDKWDMRDKIRDEARLTISPILSSTENNSENGVQSRFSITSIILLVCALVLAGDVAYSMLNRDKRSPIIGSLIGMLKDKFISTE